MQRPAPLIPDSGVFLIYNGADLRRSVAPDGRYLIRVIPPKFLARAQEPIVEPLDDWEKNPHIPTVAFVDGAVRDGNRWLFYYGGAETTWAQPPLQPVGFATLRFRLSNRG